MFVFVALVLSSARLASAAETTYTLDPVIFSAQASFETLGEESVVPKTRAPIDPARTSVVKRIRDSLIFPTSDLGFPAGVSAVKLGGRTVEDTQVSTLGVPLNLPQGGGADLSVLPSFLWSAAEYAPTPLASGYAPTSASGSLNLLLWTREEVVRRHHADDADNRLTFSYDRQVQSFSIATEKPGIAINAGMDLGLLTGPAGSLSYEFYRDATSTYRLHFIGTDQDGDSPGSLSFPTPGAHLRTWRLIPILETEHDLGGDWVLESTFFADISGIVYSDPASLFSNTTTRVQQYGIENALLYGDYTFALSVRYEHFLQSPSIVADEWPLLASASRAFHPSRRWELKATAEANGINTLGVRPGGRLSARLADSDDPHAGHSFAELFTTPKMPTLSARYYVLPSFYQGNPDLQPERIYSLILGYEKDLGSWKTRTSLKGEFRSQVQINRNQTTENAGNARLLYLDQELEWRVFERLTLGNHFLLSTSHLNDAGIPYPDLPAFAWKGRANYRFSPVVSVEGRAHYQGPSVSAAFPSGGRFHPNYALFDLETDFQIEKNLAIQAGVENLTDNRAEIVLDYPLPGRMVFLGVQASL